MRKSRTLAVTVAAVAAFVVGGVWYSPLLFGAAYARLRGMNPDAMANASPPVGELIGEFTRAVVVAYVLSRFIVWLGISDWIGAIRLGVWVWVGFQAMLLIGAVLHEGMPWTLYAIHAGDALVKTPLMCVILVALGPRPASTSGS